MFGRFNNQGGNNWFGNEPGNGIPMWLLLALAGYVLVWLFVWFLHHAGY